MSGKTNTNWGQSVAGVIVEDNKILLARHTYGSGKRMLIIPGGYVNTGETPQNALKREFMEETGLDIVSEDVIGIRFNMHDWYVVFTAKILAGDIKPDGIEISEVIWMDINKALDSDEVPGLTKSLIRCAVKSENKPLSQIEYDSNVHAPYSLYGLK